MKKVTFILSLVFISFFVFTSCQKGSQGELTDPSVASANRVVAAGNLSLSGRETPVPDIPGACNPNAYIITLESHTQVNGNWEWVWSVQNSNPGNGSNGTVQNLSHWGMQFGACVNIASIINAAYSADGNTWTEFTPGYSVDPSQSCATTPVFKFDYGTTGAAKSYYRLTTTENYTAGSTFGYYKSGVKTGCCTFTFMGLSCDEGDIR